MASPLHRYPYAYGFDNHRFYSQEEEQQQPTLDDENQLPTPDEFKCIIDDYLSNLSPKKRDKALVDHDRYCLIQQVLRDPRNTAISTAQFRFWVKKMFSLQPGSTEVVCHDNKPVAMKEQIYGILVRAHREAHHGGRDKTSALVRRQFSWIPKELVARFVRHCPFCITRRNGGHSPHILSKLPSPSITTATLAANNTNTHPNANNNGRPFGFDLPAPPPMLYTPSLQEDSDVSPSGPASEDIGFDKPYNGALTPLNTRRPPPMLFYDRPDDAFLHNYTYEPTLHPLFVSFGDRQSTQSPQVPPMLCTPSLQDDSDVSPSSSYWNHYYAA